MYSAAKSRAVNEWEEAGPPRATWSESKELSSRVWSTQVSLLLPGTPSLPSGRLIIAEVSDGPSDGDSLGDYSDDSP